MLLYNRLGMPASRSPLGKPVPPLGKPLPKLPPPKAILAVLPLGKPRPLKLKLLEKSSKAVRV